MKLVLIRGLPGSAKSTIAENLREFVHVEADDFWTVDGNYNFDVKRIREAHENCLKRTEVWLDRGYKVVVANTFTTKPELEPYFILAQKYRITPNIILCQSNFGNVHNVPQDILNSMDERFEYNISSLFEKYKLEEFL